MDIEIGYGCLVGVKNQSEHDPDQAMQASPMPAFMCGNISALALRAIKKIVSDYNKPEKIECP